jgi:hypothetical protein
MGIYIHLISVFCWWLTLIQNSGLFKLMSHSVYGETLRLEAGLGLERRRTPRKVSLQIIGFVIYDDSVRKYY